MKQSYEEGLERFLIEAKQTYTRIFNPECQAELKTFSQREVCVYEEGRRLSRALLEKHLAQDKDSQPAANETTPCPCCQHISRQVKGSSLELRMVTTLVGEVIYPRTKYRCSHCRKIFFLLDQTLQLGSSRRSPEVLKRTVEQGGNSSSFKQASQQLQRLLNVEIGAKETQRLTEQTGRQWVAIRDAQVEQFKHGKLERLHAQAPQAAVIMVDGGRSQIRANESGPGVHEPGWREVKYASLATLASRVSTIDPQPEPPSKLLNPERIKKIVGQIHDQHVPARQPAASQPMTPTRKRKRRKRSNKLITRLVTTFVASMQNSEQFGYMVATEMFLRSLDRAERRAYVCDGLPYNWSIFEEHFRAPGFVPILDFIHLVGYLYAAAHALENDHAWRAWSCYERWLRWAWSGERQKLLGALQTASAKVGLPPKNAAEQDRRAIVAKSLDYVVNNYDRIDYPRYRKLGLPCSSAPMESAVKQFSRRVKGTEKFWLQDGVEAVLQVRAACLSQDDRIERLWAQPIIPHAYGSNWMKIAS